MRLPCTPLAAAALLALCPLSAALPGDGVASAWGATTEVTDLFPGDNADMVGGRTIAMGPDGTLHCVFAVDFPGAGGIPGSRYIGYSRSTDDGATFGSGIDNYSLLGGGADTEPALSPCLAVDPEGRVHVAWIEPDGGAYQIFYRRSLDGGLSWEAEQRITQGSSSVNVSAPAIDIFVDQDHWVVVCWNGTDASGLEGTLFEFSGVDGAPGTWSHLPLEYFAEPSDNARFVQFRAADALDPFWVFRVTHFVSVDALVFSGRGIAPASFVDVVVADQILDYDVATHPDFPGDTYLVCTYVNAGEQRTTLYLKKSGSSSNDWDEIADLELPDGAPVADAALVFDNLAQVQLLATDGGAGAGAYWFYTYGDVNETLALSPPVSLGTLGDDAGGLALTQHENWPDSRVYAVWAERDAAGFGQVRARRYSVPGGTPPATPLDVRADIGAPQMEVSWVPAPVAQRAYEYEIFITGSATYDGFTAGNDQVWFGDPAYLLQQPYFQREFHRIPGDWPMRDSKTGELLHYWAEVIPLDDEGAPGAAAEEVLAVPLAEVNNTDGQCTVGLPDFVDFQSRFLQEVFTGSGALNPDYLLRHDMNRNGQIDLPDFSGGLEAQFLWTVPIDEPCLSYPYDS